MIQRIQSIFLFLASGACFAMFGLPFASTDKAISDSTLFADSAYTITDHIALTILFAGAGALALAAIFLFRNRPLQINLSRVAFIAAIIGFVLGIILFLNDGIVEQSESMPEPADGFGAVLPVLAGIFLLLAIRYINKDEKLVKSSNRLR
ncbi:MAG: DUF4293 domain-containing protein [Bacteroidota bacterium]